MLFEYLKEHYEDGEPIFLDDIHIEGMRRDNFRQQIKTQRGAQDDKRHCSKVVIDIRSARHQHPGHILRGKGNEQDRRAHVVFPALPAQAAAVDVPPK